LTETNIRTDADLSPSLRGYNLGGLAMPSLNSINGRIYEEARRELRFPENQKLYKTMLLDTNISSSVMVIETIIGRSNWRISSPKDASEEDRKRAELLNKNLHQLERPFEEYIEEFIPVSLGFTPVEKIYQKMSIDGVEFKGWKDFPVISQDTVEGWLYKKGSKTLGGLRQDLKVINSDLKVNGKSYIDIPRKYFMLFRHRPKRDNPEGRSALLSCYFSWKQRNVVAEYQTVGVAKDYGGVVDIGVEQTVLSRAIANANSDEAKMIEILKSQAENLHAGQSTTIVRPLAYNDSGKELYSFSLKGIDGGGKQYNTVEILKYYDQLIQMAFLADVLSLGKDGGGSYALSENKLSLLQIGIQSIQRNIQRTLNHDLIRQTYALNGWEYDPQTSARFEYEVPEEDDLDILSKFVQRVMAVGAIRPTKELESHLLDKGFSLEPYDDNTEYLDTESTSRSGDGMKEGLPSGTGKANSGGDSSAGNKENASSNSIPINLGKTEDLSVINISGKDVLVMSEDISDFTDERD